MNHPPPRPNKQCLCTCMAILSMCLFGACATLSDQECLQADWRLIGFEDGLEGHRVERIGAHRQACAAVGVIPDLVTYQQGRDDGLLRYCTLFNGLREGKLGHSYNGVCAPGSEPPFLEGYRLGRHNYDVREELEVVHRQIEEIEDEIHSDEVDDHDRKHLHHEIRDLDRQIGRLQQELHFLESEERALTRQY